MLDNEPESVIPKTLHVSTVTVAPSLVKTSSNSLNKHLKLKRCTNINATDCESIFMYE